MSIIPLAEANDYRQIGNKAASLGRLIRSGFRVPSGFVITPNTPTKFDKQMVQAILKAFDGLNIRHVAVRSSAIGEDDENATWAGQLETFLNVERNDLLKNIEACQVSAESARAKAYGSQKNLRLKGVAVIVQAMVQSEVSGVAFSVHPVTQNGNQIVIEAVQGLGEALVSGRVTPDTYITEKTKGLILKKYISTQTEQLRLTDGLSSWQLLKNGNKQKLPDKQIQQLAKIITKLEIFYDLPIDVEWAWAGGQFFITQARPITTLGLE